MKASIEKKFNYLSIVKKKHDTLDSIDRQEVSFQRYAAHQERITQAREFYAASRIGALIRGYLDRIACKKLRRYRRAVLLIQRLMKGKLGRMRWQREYFRSVSVVKSDHALAEILKRSKVLREHIQPTARSKVHWQELFDPLTNSFWYFNLVTRQNTWVVPFCFQKDLICTWEGYEEYGGMPKCPPCRAVFSNAEAYANHQLTAHKWYCNACFQCNSGLLFPTCPVCGNKYSVDGQDGERALRASIEKVHRQLSRFLAKDMDEGTHAGTYSIRDRLIDIASYRRSNLSSIEAIALQQQGDPQGNGNGGREAQRAINEHYLANRGSSYEQQKAAANRVTGLLVYQPKVGVTAALTAPAFKDSNNNSSSNGYNTVVLEASSRQWAATGGLEGERQRYLDPALRGLLSGDDFAILTSIHEDDLQATVALNLFDDDSSSGDEEEQGQGQGVRSLVDVAALTGIPRNSNKGQKLLVCEGFIQGTCKLFACPLAHPGLRDNAKVRTRIAVAQDGSKKRMSYVTLCTAGVEAGTGAGAGGMGMEHLCPSGKACRSYHMYLRPSTQQIIRALYPISSGHKHKLFPSGATLHGNAVNDVFQGYGTMHWASGAVYMGDWANGVRHGRGVYRGRGGVEYAGEYAQGRRHGWGVYTSATGEEYCGQWADGKMHGVGQLRCSNGDVYMGHFANSQYEGTGYFLRANGDCYMGGFRKSQAHGLGVLALSTREKYKGYFEHNARHGMGVCVYPNGCRYSGYWYRGVHEGFGMFLSADGEQYVGHWQANQKHGKGRYVFRNGDFYDGDFHRNMAQGMGVYYHANGNVYSGQWAQDKRNGKGTYCFTNGSKYTGQWLDNNIHHKGRFDFANGAFYRGQFDVNTKHGRGVYTWPNGAVYRGDFYRERLHGQGEISYMHGHHYAGEWANNQKHGIGTFRYANGVVYEGMFHHDIRHGFGKLTLMAGTPVEEVYEGQWADDLWHGQGKYTYRRDEGMVYEGEWAAGVRHGRGLLTFKDGSYYRGDFRKDQMWGRGVYVGSDSSQYDGEWRANMRQGTGTAIDADGSIYSGEFFGNMRQGSGKLIRSDGSVYEGQWDAGIVVGTGRITITVGDKSNGSSALPKTVTLKVFGY